MYCLRHTQIFHFLDYALEIYGKNLLPILEDFESFFLSHDPDDYEKTKPREKTISLFQSNSCYFVYNIWEYSGNRGTTSLSEQLFIQQLQLTPIPCSAQML